MLSALALASIPALAAAAPYKVAPASNPLVRRQTPPDVYTIYAGSYNETILTFTFDPAAANLSLVSTLSTTSGGWNDSAPSWMQPSFTQADVAYVCDEGTYGQAIAFNTTDLSVLGAASSEGFGPAYLGTTTDGKWVMAPNYGDGNILPIPLDEATGLFKETNDQPLIQFSGAGPTEYQTSPHPHMALEHPVSGHIFVPDLGLDVIHELALSSSGTWELIQNITISPAGSGPRHIRFSPDGTSAYLACELTSALHTFKVTSPAAASEDVTKFEEVDVVSVLPPNSTAIAGQPLAVGEILLTMDGKAVYVSNRDSADPDGDAITLITLDPQFTTSVADVAPQYFRTEGVHIRGMELDPFEEKYLIAGNMLSSSVAVFERKEDQTLEKVAFLDVPGNYEITTFLFKL